MLQVVAWHRLVECDDFEVPAGAGCGPFGVEPVGAGTPPVRAGRAVVRCHPGCGDDLRHRRHDARRGEWLWEHLTSACLGTLDSARRLGDGLLWVSLTR